MTDPITTLASVATILSGVKNAFDFIVDHAKASEDNELLKSVMDAQSGLMDLQTSVYDRDNYIRELQEKVRILNNFVELVPNDECYWAWVDEDWDGPFCLPCGDVRKHKVRMVDRGRNVNHPYVMCPECQYATQSAATPPPGDGGGVDRAAAATAR